MTALPRSKPGAEGRHSGRSCACPGGGCAQRRPGAARGRARALEGLERPFDRARHLLLGEHLRRDRRRAAARHHLRAVNEFGNWVPRSGSARNELAATGKRFQRRDRGAAQAPTPQRRRIARIVADGITNREVAAQLFLSARTIDYHLRNVFVKLGIASRAELIRNPP